MFGIEIIVSLKNVRKIINENIAFTSNITIKKFKPNIKLDFVCLNKLKYIQSSPTSKIALILITVINQLYPLNKR
jgi:hypothetical protein